MEVMATHFIDKRIEAGKSPERTRVTLWVSALILIEAVLVAVDGLGKSGVFKFWGDQAWKTASSTSWTAGLRVLQCLSAQCSCL